MSDEHSDQPHVFPEGRKPGEKLFAALTIVIACILLACIAWQTTWLPGKGMAAQPRFWPALALIGTIMFGVLNLMRRLEKPRTPGRWQEALVWIRALEYIGWYMVYVALIPFAGYLISTIAFCSLLALRVGYRGRAVLFAACFGLGVVLIFKTGFNVKIPAGQIYDYAPESIRYILLRYL